MSKAYQPNWKIWLKITRLKNAYDCQSGELDEILLKSWVKIYVSVININYSLVEMHKYSWACHFLCCKILTLDFGFGVW
jgi:hypothetical protein